MLHRSRFGRRLAVLAASVAVAVLSTPRHLEGQWSITATAGAERVVLEVWFADITSVTIEAVKHGPVTLLPLADVCAAAELHCDARVGEMVPVDSVAAVLHARIDLDWPELALRITDCAHLPVLKRRARERDRAELAARLRKPQFLRPDSVVRAGLSAPRSLRLDYRLTAISTGWQRSSEIAEHSIGISAAAFGGALRGTLSMVRPVGRSGRSGRAGLPSLSDLSWLRAWPTGRAIRQLELGSLRRAGTTGPVYGITVSNQPYGVWSAADSVAVTGTTLPLHDVDVFREGSLIASGVASESGHYKLWLPYDYGRNAVTVIAYLDEGQSRESDRMLLLPAGLLSARQFRYEAALGRCRLRDCSFADVLLSYAPLPWITTTASATRVQVEHSRATLAANVRLIARISDGIAATAEHLPDEGGSAELHYTPGAAVDLVARYRQHYPSNPGTSTVTSTNTSMRQGSGEPGRAATIDIAWTPRSRGTPSFNAQLDNIRARSQTTTTLRLSSTAAFRHARATLFTRFDRRQVPTLPAHTALSLGADVVSSPITVPQLIGGAALRLTAESGSWTSPGFVAAGIVASSIGSLRLDAGATWLRRHGPSVSIAGRATFRGFRFSSTVAALGAGAATIHAIVGSVLIDVPARRITRPAIDGTARVTGTVFIDRNRNGRFDPADEPIPGAYVHSGESGTTADSAGRYQLVDLQSFTPLMIALDALSLPSPALIPLHARIGVDLAPDQLLRLDIAVIESPDLSDSAPLPTTSDSSLQSRRQSEPNP